MVAPTLPVMEPISLDEVTGASGELVELLGAAVTHEGMGSGELWLQSAFWAVAGVGGGGGTQIRDHLVAKDRDQFLVAFLDRVEKLVMAGVGEEFVVLSVRSWVTDRLNRYADVEDASRRRTSIREVLQDAVDDPSVLNQFRSSERLAKIDDAKLLSILRQQLEGFAPLTPDEVAERWSAVEAWRSSQEHWLSEPILERWRSQHRP